MFIQDGFGYALPRAALYRMRMLLHHETRLNDFFASALMQLDLYVRSILGNLRLYKYDVIPSRIARMVTIDFNSDLWTFTLSSG